VRFIGAAPVRQGDRLAVLDAAGQLSLHAGEELASAGAVQGETPLLAFGILPLPVEKPAKP
jgi:hypothetical protein